MMSLLRTLPVAIFALAFLLAPVFLRSLGGDFVAYALAPANWLERGTFALPQLGTQYELDRYWRFNSPLMGVGPLPFFALFGISHGSYLAGVTLLSLITGVGFAVVVRRLLKQPWSLCFLLAMSFLSVRAYQTEFVNQRFTVIAPLAIALLFWPYERARAWQWCLAGVMPLIHPALLPASVVWVLAESLSCYREWRRNTFGFVLFALGVAGCAAWYLEPHSFQTQFYPHLTSRNFSALSGWMQFATWKYALPSMAIMLAVIVSAAIAVKQRNVPRRVIVLLLVVLAMDFGGYMFYLAYFLVGLGPVCLNFAKSRNLIRLIAILGIVNAIVFVKLLPNLPRLPTNQAAAEAFVVSHSRPGEAICLGPPFVLVAAKPMLADARRVEFVVPTALYLRDFDEPKFLDDIRARCTVYIGKREHYHAVQLYYKLSSPPVFLSAHIEELDFEGEIVIVARNTR